MPNEHDSESVAINKAAAVIAGTIVVVGRSMFLVGWINQPPKAHASVAEVVSPGPSAPASTPAPRPPIVCCGMEGDVNAHRFMIPPPDGNVMDNVLSHEVLITRREGDVSVIQEMIRTRTFERITPMLAASRFFVVQNGTRARALAVSGKHLKVRFAIPDSFYSTEGWIPNKLFEPNT
jgi:hypothetical protein